jgi:hypothetical protein
MKPESVAEQDIQVVEQAPLSSETPLAPAISGALVDLRESWMTDEDQSPNRNTPKKLSWHIRFRREFRWLWKNLVPWRARQKERPSQPRAQRTTSARRFPRTSPLTRILYTIAALSFAVSLALYMAILMNLLNPRRLAAILERR